MVDRALVLASESGSIMSRAHALAEAGFVQMQRGELDAAEAALDESRQLFSELGASMNLGRTVLRLGEVALRRGDMRQAERFARESIRVLKPLEDRGTLCESQRLLAEVLVQQGKLAEAERVALEAVETTGPHDVSSQASTRYALAQVRAAQGREDDAEALMRDGLERLVGTGYLSLEARATARLDEFLRKRGRPDDALAARLAELREPDVASGEFTGTSAAI
jgi:ATP/maltotriose-dependent transcriptional regulator MalT